MNFQPNLSEVILFSPSEKCWLYFCEPESVITCDQVGKVIDALQEIEHQVDKNGKYAAGFVTYEAAPAFGREFQVKPNDQGLSPLIWFGIYATPKHLPADAMSAKAELIPGSWQADVTKNDYRRAIRRIKRHIAAGDTYQVNYTYQLLSECTIQPWSLFGCLTMAHNAPYAAYLETEDFAICSLSPELFFQLNGETIISRPMKGTVERGRTPAEDRAKASWLQRSQKNRAENVMIVDMARNDLGRIARTGSVQVPELFKVEKYPTVWQMTSTVSAKTQAGLVEIMGALFPAASITGAPKIRTMQIIAALERETRGIYTGAIGYFAPERKAQFNVAIRTLWIDKSKGEAVYGVGGGIVWDSQPKAEWEETKTKTRVISEPPLPFDLLETLRWTPAEGWFLLEEHLARLQNSAEYFDFLIDPSTIRRDLEILAKNFGDQPQRVRMTVNPRGACDLEYRPLTPVGSDMLVGIAPTPVNSTDRFLYHKTTRRQVYENARAEAPGYDDVLLVNERSELTESTVANLIVESAGQLYTPPVRCGLLAGTYRGWLRKKQRVEERVIKLEEISGFDRIYLANSVRGLWPVRLDASTIHR